MIQKIHPRLRMIGMWLPVFALLALMWWSRAPGGKVGLQVPPTRRILVVFDRQDRTRGTARFDVDAGTIIIGEDGRERTMSWSCPGFSGDVEAVSIRPKYQSLDFTCFRRAGEKDIVSKNILDPEKMTIVWRETSTDASGKAAVAHSLNFESRDFDLERKYLERKP